MKKVKKDKPKPRATRTEMKERVAYTVQLICSGLTRRKDAYAVFNKRYPEVAVDTFKGNDWLKAQKHVMKASQKNIDQEIGNRFSQLDYLYKMALAVENNDIDPALLKRLDDAQFIPPSLKQIATAKGVLDSLIKLKGLSAAKKIDLVSEGTAYVDSLDWVVKNKKARELKEKARRAAELVSEVSKGMASE